MMIGKGIAGVVFGLQVELRKRDIEAYDLYQEKAGLGRALMVTSFLDRNLRAVQSAQSPSEMWRKLNARHAANAMEK